MIYFIKAKKTGHIKIGRTDNFHVRLQALKAKHGELEVLGVMRGSYTKEGELHDQFKHLMARVQGIWRCEWHKEAPELLEFIRENTEPEELKRLMSLKNVKRRGSSRHSIYLDDKAYALAAELAESEDKRADVIINEALIAFIEAKGISVERDYIDRQS